MCSSDLPIYRPDPMKTPRACGEQGDKAVTHWQSLGTVNGRSLLRIYLETGRTHQIRVHFAHIGCPLCGDDMYGGSGFSHQLLHCESAAFIHPVTGTALKITAPMPDEMLEASQNILDIVV